MDDGFTARGTGLTAVDLFCGAGGLSAGFEAAGFEIAYALDRDFDSCETYRLNHQGTKIDQIAIADRTPRAMARTIGDVDVVLGGPSCQGFSTHGRRFRWHAQGDERNKLWRAMRYLVKEVRPKAFLLENVPGLVYYKDGRVGGEIVELFERIGFAVHSRILLAADYGVPQLRRRVFVVGVRQGYLFKFPEPTHLGGFRRDMLEKWEAERQRRGLLPHLTAWDAVGDLPAANPGAAGLAYPTGAVSSYAELMRDGSEVVFDHQAAPLWERYAGLVRHIPPGGTWRDVPPHLLPDRYRGMRRTDSTNLLGRIDPRRPAYTMTTQYNNVTAGCFIHPFEDRALTVREGARIQSFPDRYRLVGSVTSRCRQVGNAVPPLLAQHLACAIAESVMEGAKPKRPRAMLPQVNLVPPSVLTRARMTTQQRKHTAPELVLRKALFRRGLRYRVNARPLADLRREADVLFIKSKVAVFLDGCFWHGCPQHARPTKSNTRWWAEKIAKNRTRDDETTRVLEAAGWAVIRVWEHEEPEKAAERVEGIVRARSAIE